MTRRLGSLPPLVATIGSLVASTPKAGASGFHRSNGLSSTARGYGADWRRKRAEVLRAEPLCRLCAEAGRVTPATDVDHIESFAGPDDPLRLDRSNLRPLCGPCHRARSARQAAGQRG